MNSTYIYMYTWKKDEIHVSVHAQYICVFHVCSVYIIIKLNSGGVSRLISELINPKYITPIYVGGRDGNNKADVGVERVIWMEGRSNAKMKQEDEPAASARPRVWAGATYSVAEENW